MGSECEGGGAHETEVVDVVVVQVFEGVNHLAGEIESLQGVENEVTGNGGKGGTEVEEDEGRVGIGGGRGEGGGFDVEYVV